MAEAVGAGGARRADGGAGGCKGLTAPLYLSGEGKAKSSSSRGPGGTRGKLVWLVSQAIAQDKKRRHAALEEARAQLPVRCRASLLPPLLPCFCPFPDARARPPTQAPPGCTPLPHVNAFPMPPLFPWVARHPGVPWVMISKEGRRFELGHALGDLPRAFVTRKGRG